MKWKTWNDQLSLVLMLAIIGLWVAVGFGLTLPGEVIGATISAFTLVAFFYFRKAPPSSNGTNGGSTPSPPSPS